jgi:hypothetical protein
MRRRSILLCLVLFSAAPSLLAEDGAGSSADVAATEMQDLKKVIPFGISLLEKQDYQTFLKTFVEPEHLAKQTKGKTFVEFANAFAKEKADALLAMMKATKGVEPKLEKNGDVAIFTIPEETAKAANLSRSEIAFVRIEKKWYIRN